MVKWASIAAVLSLGLASACVTDGDEIQLDETTQDIVGGTATQITAVPWQVSLQDAQGNHFCGGSIVTPTWIVTASHCLQGAAPGRVVAHLPDEPRRTTSAARRRNDVGGAATAAPNDGGPRVAGVVHLLMQLHHHVLHQIAHRTQHAPQTSHGGDATPSTLFTMHLRRMP